jgi:hypothetical protein
LFVPEFSEEIFGRRKLTARLAREILRAARAQQDMLRLFHHAPRQRDGMFDAAHCRHRPGA